MSFATDSAGVITPIVRHIVTGEVVARPGAVVIIGMPDNRGGWTNEYEAKVRTEIKAAAPHISGVILIPSVEPMIAVINTEVVRVPDADT